MAPTGRPLLIWALCTTIALVALACARAAEVRVTPQARTLEPGPPAPALRRVVDLDLAPVGVPGGRGSLIASTAPATAP